MAQLRPSGTDAFTPLPASGQLDPNWEHAKPSDLSHHFNRVTRERTPSAIKNLYKYFQVPEVINLAGALPFPGYFPYDTLESAVSTSGRFPSNLIEQLNKPVPVPSISPPPPPPKKTLPLVFFPQITIVTVAGCLPQAENIPKEPQHKLFTSDRSQIQARWPTGRQDRCCYNIAIWPSFRLRSIG